MHKIADMTHGVEAFSRTYGSEITLLVNFIVVFG
jgi:hypothetical protein